VNIQPIVFAAPTVSPSVPRAKANWLPWVVVAAVVAFLIWDRVSLSDVTPGPVPVVIDEATAGAVQAASKSYAAELSRVMDDLANRVDAGSIKNWEQLSSNARALSQPARERAFAPIDQLDTAKIPSGEWTENKAVVSMYLRSKAEGHRRASK